MRLWAALGYTMVGGERLTSFLCPKVGAGCHFGDTTLLGIENTIQRISKDVRENRGHQIGVYKKGTVRVEPEDFHRAEPTLGGGNQLQRKIPTRPVLADDQSAGLTPLEI